MSQRLAAAISVVAAAAALAVSAAPTAVADCNSSAGTTLCSSGGTVRGSNLPAPSVPTYNPYPCYGTPACDYFDNYDPGIVWDLPNLGLGGRR